MSAEFAEMVKNVSGLLKVYAPPLIAKKESAKGYELWTPDEVTISGRTYPELFFAAVAVQKNFVGFYYFPIYCRPELKQKLHPDLLKALKGKTCFHLKKDDKEMHSHISAALKLGFDFYKAQGWT